MSSSPLVLRDPRFDAGRALIQTGRANDGAIELFSTLLEECIAKHGETSIETCPAFYEYGNALLRATTATEASTPTEDEEDADTTAHDARHAMVAATLDGKAVSTMGNKEDEDDPEATPEGIQSSGKDTKDDEKEGDDLLLSLEMMENAYSILEEYYASQQPYKDWIRDQLPRVLLGIGDCLSALQRHADAADAYSRAQEHRQNQLDEIMLLHTNRTSTTTTGSTGTMQEEKEVTMEQLQCQRRVCEATVLIAEELLACPDGKDVITTETQSLIVKADERIEYARGYYDRARDSLQDTVYIMGKLAAKRVELGTEKEDVCFLATMIMGVGERLAALDEERATTKRASVSTESMTKKAKYT